MADNIIPLGTVTRLDLPTDRVLDAAKGRCQRGVVVLGWDEDDFYFASSFADGGTVIWLLELAKKRLLEAGEE